MIYFDSAATTFQKPRTVVSAMQGAMATMSSPGRGGYPAAMRAAEAAFDCRSELAALYHLESPEQVVFTQNCTHALNLVIHGLLRQGDHVVISDLEHNSVLRPVHTLAQRGVITYSVARTSREDGETVEAFRRCLAPNTRLILCTHGSNLIGWRLPIGALAELAAARG